MKTPRLDYFFLLLAAVNLRAQTAAVNQPPQNMPYAVVSRGPHFNVWQQTTYSQLPSGEWVPRVDQYVETATGLNFWDANTGQFQPSSEEIAPTANGAAALNAQHKVVFASDLATAGAIGLQTPDGQQLSMHLLGLCYADQGSGKSVWIAEVTNSVGQIIGPNQVWYGNAFSGVSGSVSYVNTLQGLEQNVVLEAQPQPPEAYGLSSATTVLQAVTEFMSPPTPAITTNSQAGMPIPLWDETLDFGQLRFSEGSAFLMGSQAGGVAVSKQWVTQDGRSFLVEQVPIAQIAGQLDALPAAAQTASIKRRRNSVLNVVSKKRLWPAGFAKNGSKGVRLLSQGNARQRNAAEMASHGRGARATSGFVLDYVTLNTSQTNVLFQGDTTYYISGNVGLYGTNVFFEGGTVLKYASNVTLAVNVPVSWGGANYRPVVMLSKDCDTTGEPISGSSGTPGSNYYATTALNFNGTAALTNLTIKNLRIENARVGVALNGQSGHVLDDVQMVYCRNGIAATNTDFSLHNALFDRVRTNFTGNSATGRVEQLTSDTAVWLNQNIGANLFLTNCVLTAVTNLGSCTTDHVANLSNSNAVFQTAVGGNYYLAVDSPYRNAGTTNISMDTLMDLSNRTTYPPIVYQSNSFNVPMTFNPQVQRDSGDAPDLGWHYDPIDWVFSQCDANTNLMFTAGTAVGWFRSTSGSTHAGHGIHIGNQQLVSFNGTATAPDYWVRCNAVQEQDNTGGSGPGGITSWASQTGPYSNAATVGGQFLKSIAVGSWGENSFRDDSGFLIGRFNNCEFYTTGIGAYISTYFFTNCLLYRTPAGVWQGSSGNQMVFQNCTIWGSYIYLEPTNTLGIVVKDCSLDGGVVGMTTNLGANASYATYDYNAYSTTTNPFTIGGTHDHASMSFNWETSWFGNFYLPTNSILMNGGDVTADTIGLYHFTIETNQVIEGTNLVSIGYHYVVTDTNGVPLDTNADGVPDYLEDANGNGLVDSGEVGWNINGDLGLKVLITRPKNNSLIP